jgi:hypothetical protein
VSSVSSVSSVVKLIFSVLKLVFTQRNAQSCRQRRKPGLRRDDELWGGAGD